MIEIKTRPQPIQIELKKTAVIVVDMQNSFVSKGGAFDCLGIDISGAQHIIQTCKNIIMAARKKGCKIIYLQHSYNPDLSDSGGKNSPNWFKDPGLFLYRENPEMKDKLHYDGSWGVEIIEDLKPLGDSIIVKKQRYSGFAGTNLNIILQTFEIKYLFFIGTATNVCVDSTIRDAFSLDYFPVLISDAVSHAGADFIQDATIYNVKFAFGWVIDSTEFCNSLKVR